MEREGKFLEEQKNETIAKALPFVSNRGQVSKILRSKERRTFEEDPRGGYRGDDVLRLGEENLDEAEAIIEGNGYEGHNLDSGDLRQNA